MLYSGKAKSLYTTNNSDLLIAEFRDDTTAFDGEKHEQLKNKGRVNSAISTFIMKVLSDAGVPTHFEDVLSDTEIVVKRLNMIPLESVVRNIAAGSLCRRLGVQEKMKLEPPMYEIFLKNDELHDPLVNDNHALLFGWATREQLDTMQAITLKINSVLSDLFSKAGMIMVDAKFEFGLDVSGQIVLGDEISPDSCRIWDADTLEPLDKDRFRKDMGDVVGKYQEIADRLGVTVA